MENPLDATPTVYATLLQPERVQKSGAKSTDLVNREPDSVALPSLESESVGHEQINPHISVRPCRGGAAPQLSGPRRCCGRPAQWRRGAAACLGLGECRTPNSLHTTIAVSHVLQHQAVHLRSGAG